MGFRYQKRIKLLSWLTLNISKKGFSFTFGKRGASLNVGSKGSSVNVGIPGSGASYRKKLTKPKK